MDHVTQKFETRYLSPDSEQPLIEGLLKIIYLPDLWYPGYREQRQIIEYVLNSLINLTKCERFIFGREDERSEFATD